jgi:hypothetical protein
MLDIGSASLLSTEHCRRPHVPSSLDQLFGAIDPACLRDDRAARVVTPELAHAARGLYGQPGDVWGPVAQVVRAHA